LHEPIDSDRCAWRVERSVDLVMPHVHEVPIYQRSVVSVWKNSRLFSIGQMASGILFCTGGIHRGFEIARCLFSRQSTTLLGALYRLAMLRAGAKGDPVRCLRRGSCHERV
jgi:hypothetical protein